MQIMDLFPQMLTRLDPGMAGYYRQGAKNARSDTRFSDILSSVRTAAAPEEGSTGSRAIKTDDTDKRPPGYTEDEDALGPAEPAEDEDDGGDIVAISILGQGNIVLILEGNREIDAAPEVQSDADIGIEPASEPAAQVIQGEQAPVLKAEAEGTQDSETMEQMARMPEIAEKPKEETKAGELSDSGDLCPLENGNEKKGAASETNGKRDKAPHIARVTEEKPADDGDDKAERVIPTQQTVDVRPEKLSSSERLRGAAADRPVTQENLFDAMIDNIETMRVDGMNRMSIQLKPEFLGKVSLQLSMTAAGLQVKINADDLNVKNAIGGQIHALIETLSGKGIELAEVEVLHTGVGGYDFTNSQGGGAQPEQSSSSRRYAPGEAADMTGFGVLPAEDALSALDDGVSSVEYRA